MKRILPFSLIVLAAIVLSACGSANRSVGYGGAAPAAEPYYFEEEYAAEAPMPAADMGVAQSESSRAGGVDAANVERMIIENADLGVVVSDVEASMKAIQDMAKEMGGFVVSSNMYTTYRNGIEAPEASLTIRIPSQDLNAALNRIKDGAVEVQSENRSGQDVTSQYVDLKSRLKNLEAAERQLSEIMENATETEDVVNVFNQLVYYREQIELVKGQMKYLEEASALSAINIQLIAEETVLPVQIGKWEPKGIALEAIQDLIDFWKGFVDFLIRFVIFTLPVLITIAIPLYLGFLGIRWVIRKLRGAKKVEKKVEEVEEKK
jgi:hypothetical protein